MADDDAAPEDLRLDWLAGKVISALKAKEEAVNKLLNSENSKCVRAPPARPPPALDAMHVDPDSLPLAPGAATLEAAALEAHSREAVRAAAHSGSAHLSRTYLLVSQLRSRSSSAFLPGGLCPSGRRAR